MKLKDFLEALTTENVQIVLTDLDTGSVIADMKVAGFASLDDTIENRQVMQWSINSATSIKAILGAEVTP